MKRIFLVCLLSLCLGKEGFARCPTCPEKAIKREAKTSQEEKIKKKAHSPSASRLQKKVERKEPPIASAKTPFVSPASHILKKEKEITLPDGTILHLIDPKDLKDAYDLPD